MSDSVSRREFLERVAILGAAIGVVPILAACGTKTGATGTGGAGAGQAVALDCSDVSKLTDAERKTRIDLQYVEQSVKPNQSCTSCQQHKPAADPKTCGACTLVPGPINPNGWCISWVQKVA